MANERAEPHRPRCACRLGRLLPEEYRKHRRVARRERLLSWRSVLDAAVGRLEEGAEDAEATGELGLVPESFWMHRQAAREEDLLAVRSLVDSFLGWVEAWLEEPPKAEVTTRILVE